jgi:hypothetical protein
MSALADYLWHPQGLHWPGGRRGRVCRGGLYDPACKGCGNRWWGSGQPGFYAAPKPHYARYNWNFICESCGLRLGLVKP